LDAILSVAIEHDGELVITDRGWDSGRLDTSSQISIMLKVELDLV
jgi:hypothetical protein